MYEQFLYFWLMWIIFIIVTFFMQTNRKRTFLMIWILLMITSTNLYISVQSIQISFNFILLFVGTIIFYVYNSFSAYKMILTFTIMIGYVSILIWQKITPIWFFMPSYFMIPVLIVILILLLIPNFYEQLPIGIMGIVFGQFLFEWIIISYRLHDVIGNKSFFIHVCFIILFLIFVRATQITVNKMMNVIRRYT